MQNKCKSGTDSIYKKCRKDATTYNEELNSRISAAELLGISESSLRDYELLITPVPEDVVVRMAELYNAPELENYYCMNDCPIGKHIDAPMSCDVKELESIACSFLFHSDGEKLNGARNTILRIASNGKFDSGEQEEMQQVVDYLENLSRDVSDMRLLLKKKLKCGIMYVTKYKLTGSQTNMCQSCSRTNCKITL